MGIADRLFALSPLQVGIGHLAGDWPWTDECDLCNQIIKPLRIVSWQRGHLCPALDLEHAHGISLSDYVIRPLDLGGDEQDPLSRHGARQANQSCLRALPSCRGRVSRP